MRILYLDIDSLRPDHLGCYGYHRDTSPNIDAIAKRGQRFTATYASDVPCLPSRTALFSGRFGLRTGVVNHGGARAEPYNDGPGRGFSNLFGRTSWMRTLREAGYHTASISPFAERHAAWHFYASFSEFHNPGGRGLEGGDEIAPLAVDWLKRNGQRENWFLHVNLWDPHTPYRAPQDQIDFFADAPLPAWLTEEVRTAHWQGCGPHSAREPVGFAKPPVEYTRQYPKQPDTIDSMAQVRRMFDGYDAGVRYADHWLGEIVGELGTLGIEDSCAIIVSADHGENLGELNVYGDHQTADQFTCRVPAIMYWPGLDRSQGESHDALLYQFDLAATITELAGGKVPNQWHGRSFAAELRDHSKSLRGRETLVLSQGAWTCQRALRFRKGGNEWLFIATYHDGYHAFDESMLFDLGHDPHEQENLAAQHQDLVVWARNQINDWRETILADQHPSGKDPFATVIAEGGPKHTRGELAAYLERLRSTGRGHWADLLELKHG